MKILPIIALMALVSCSKPNDQTPAPTIKVKGAVINEIKTGNQQYWKAGVIFDKAITTTGTATITWYFPAGHLNGNPSNRYSQDISFSLTGNSNGSFVFTNWQVDHTMRADSIKVKSFSASGNYSFVIE